MSCQSGLGAQSQAIVIRGGDSYLLSPDTEKPLGVRRQTFPVFCVQTPAAVRICLGQAGGRLAVVIPTREPFIAYLLVRAAMLRRQCQVAPAAAERLEVHVRALEHLAEMVGALPDDDDRLLMLGTLAVRGGQFAPLAGTEHALNGFDGASNEACSTFLTKLIGIARDDALAQARARGHLPPRRPR